jgi:hypothetical protein
MGGSGIGTLSASDDFFLKSSFWGFPRECNISKASRQFGFENRAYFQS